MVTIRPKKALVKTSLLLSTTAFQLIAAMMAPAYAQELSGEPVNLGTIVLEGGNIEAGDGFQPQQSSAIAGIDVPLDELPLSICLLYTSPSPRDRG